MADQIEVVQKVWNEMKPDGSVDKNINFLVNLCQALKDGSGLLEKPAGENIGLYQPAGKMVSISRICYPNGQLYKVLTDAGPGGANGAGWADDGLVEASRYIAVAPGLPPEGPQEPPSAPIPPPVDLEPILKEIEALKATQTAQATQLEAFANNVAGYLNDFQARLIKLETPRIVNTSRFLGHSHKVEIK